MDDDMDMKDSLMEEEDAHISEHVHWLPKLVVAVTIIGFVALAWYAYRTGTQSVNDSDLVVVEADKTPLKEKPDDPGGMKFPNQDKTIFETFSGSNQAPARVERVMPSPEEPMQRPLDTSDAKTWVNEKIQQQEAAAVAPAQPELIVGTLPSAPPAGQPNVKVVQAPAAPVKPVEQKSATVEFKPAQSAKEVVSYSKNKPSEKVKELAPAAAAPKVVDSGVIEVTSSNLEAAPEKPAAAQPVDVPAEVPAEKPAAKPVAKPAAKPATGNGKVKVQLGAYRSESEARGAFTKLQKKFSSLSGRSPIIVKADLGAKGIYYRLRVGGFATDADAKKFCGGLSAKGQACIIAK